MSLRRLTQANTGAIRASTSVERTLAAEPPAVRLDGAAVSLGGRTIWHGVSASVERGEFVAVLGPNGAGKSTLVNAILGLVPLARGSASVLGHPPGAANPQIGYLPQRRSFDPGLRIRGVDLVRLALDGNRWGLPLPVLGRFAANGRRKRDERVAEVIDLVGAEEIATRPIGQLSGGEQQRLLIAQALVHRPELLILDEPLDGLDLSNQGAVAGLVERICRSEQVAVLLVAHDINPIISYLDRVIYFASGRAVEGAPTEVVTTEALSQLYGAPVEVVRSPGGRLLVAGTPETPAWHAGPDG